MENLSLGCPADPVGKSDETNGIWSCDLMIFTAVYYSKVWIQQLSFIQCTWVDIWLVSIFAIITNPAAMNAPIPTAGFVHTLLLVPRMRTSNGTSAHGSVSMFSFDGCCRRVLWRALTGLLPPGCSGVPAAQHPHWHLGFWDVVVFVDLVALWLSLWF